MIIIILQFHNSGRGRAFDRLSLRNHSGGQGRAAHPKGAGIPQGDNVRTRGRAFDRLRLRNNSGGEGRAVQPEGAGIPQGDNVRTRGQAFDRLRLRNISAGRAGFEYHPSMGPAIDILLLFQRGGRDSNPRSRFMVPTTA